MSSWPRIAPAIYYLDAAKAIDWLCRAFGFKVRLKVEGEGGRIEHSELVYGEGLARQAAEQKGSTPEGAGCPSRAACTFQFSSTYRTALAACRGEASSCAW